MKTKSKTGKCQCRKCVVYAVLLGNQLKIRKVIPFGMGVEEKTHKCKSSTACWKHECDWWVHNRCVIIHYENTDAGEKAMSIWAKMHFVCQKHMPDVKKVGWDKELQQDVVLPSNPKKFL